MLVEQSALFGAWTDGSTENAIFDIGKDSIFYVDQLEAFPYTLKGDSLTILFPGMRFVSQARISGDTLVLTDTVSGEAKFTRYKREGE